MTATRTHTTVACSANSDDRGNAAAARAATHGSAGAAACSVSRLPRPMMTLRSCRRCSRRVRGAGCTCHRRRMSYGAGSTASGTAGRMASGTAGSTACARPRGSDHCRHPRLGWCCGCRCGWRRTPCVRPHAAALLAMRDPDGILRDTFHAPVAMHWQHVRPAARPAAQRVHAYADRRPRQRRQFLRQRCQRSPCCSFSAASVALTAPSALPASPASALPAAAGGAALTALFPVPSPAAVASKHGRSRCRSTVTAALRITAQAQQAGAMQYRPRLDLHACDHAHAGGGWVPTLLLGYVRAVGGTHGVRVLSQAA